MTRRLVAAIIIILLLLLLLRLLRERCMFNPIKLSSQPPLPSGVSASMLQVAPGVNIALYASDGTGSPIVHSHGNAGNATGSFYLFKHCKRPLVLWDYRGFGQSQGTPSSANTVSDLDKVVQWTAQQYRVQPSDITLWGRSLGTNVVMRYLDKAPHIKRVILNTPFSKLSDVLQRYGKWLGVLGALAGNLNVLPAMKRFAQRGGRALMFATKADTVTPWESAKQLVVGSNVVLHTVPGSHFTAFEHWGVLDRFLKRE